MKVLVFLDHDITCRHFVQSGGFAPLVRSADVRFVFPDDGGKRVTLDPSALPLGAPWERLPIDARRQQVWRWFLYADQLKLRLGAHEAAIRQIRRSTLGWKAATLLTLAGLPGVEPLFRQFGERRLAEHTNAALPALLDREKPDIVVHPSVLDGVFINDLIVAAAARGIPTVVCMNSWDNPSTKRAVVGQPDVLLVWGEQTRHHAMRFIGMDRDRVIPFGAAQFDVFSEPPRRTRAEIASAHGFDSARPLVLFAGSNARTDEFATLSAIDNAISAGELAGVGVIYRPHPWGGGGKDGGRFTGAAFRDISVDTNMRAYIGALARGDPGITLPDYRDTHDLLSAVDVVVSPMSTILFEAVLHKKPAIVHAPRDGGEWLATALPMLHFEEFLALPDVLVSRSNADLLSNLQNLLRGEEAAARGARLAADARRFLEPFARPWRERIVDFLYEVAAKRGIAAPKAATEAVK